ncbi:1,4-alpha-glucan branching protein GlgB [Dyadobacter chenwenxiniae]|uniref:1,4-alpha-glucan branching enzyme GlgB n=1 Tax=Dyadobacter chenwenxiniae TaxID=2906456 RepID=A0A9X1TFB3_9BACT|nr:1,4-alpha-glucan branching protein GlgB [Dyadobacter chenwenxiniae]MCF0062485.1 1,4-alpha-glucan branching protein GlgB [Dyadobacter chenwenxiniae]UON83768.1 1,4-alpha-glucan branching protein GlgB [Dyadobacter chenwenxiniae]
MTDQRSDALPMLSGFDIDLFTSGAHYHIYNKLGSHIIERDGVQGTHFAVWAPNAQQVSVVGNFNGWNRESHPLQSRADYSGIWEGFLPTIGRGEYYKYFIRSNSGYEVEKGDPYAFHWETPPHTASVVWDLDFEWSDAQWLENRKSAPPLSKPISIYEMHIGSWRRVHEEEGRFLTYRELAAELPQYCNYMGFTHVEFMPVMEHPFYGSWGYQLTGYFAPSSRFGTPQDFMYLIDTLHNAGVGVILDWVPSHFPTDEHGLGYFDGTHLYEHADPKKGFHPDWKSFIFNYGRNEVKAFLISNAIYWLDKFHIDALRVDAVASMLYLDYSRNEGEWIPNQYGGRENLEALDFLREFNNAVHTNFPDVMTIAEESTAWPGVTSPTTNGGLGFDMKWMMGWMHDTLSYFQRDPVYRSHHQGQLAFSIHYAFSEKFTLPLSHDEVVYGKNSMINKMTGNHWQQFANLRLLYGYMFGHPGAKLLFMGAEFAQRHEWRHDFSLDWDENLNPFHNGIQKVLKDLNALYQSEPALYEKNFSADGFEWIDNQDGVNSVMSWVRKGNNEADDLIFVANFTPIVRSNYRIGVSKPGYYQEIFNTDNLKYGGSDLLHLDEQESFPIPKHSRIHSIPLVLPPLAIVVLKYVRGFEWL